MPPRTKNHSTQPLFRCFCKSHDGAQRGGWGAVGKSLHKRVCKAQFGYVREFESMKIRTFANIGCWLLVFPLVAASILHGVYVWHIWGKFYDGNSYSDPVVFILSYLTPIAGLGMSGLFFLRHREL